VANNLLNVGHVSQILHAVRHLPESRVSGNWD
jgi:hypothetical protein